MILRADARVMPLRDVCVDCVVTSPPYWGLRDYGSPGQIGLEPIPDAYVAQLVAVFQEVWRVLKPSGTVWLNLGSSYFGTTPGAGGPSEKQLSNAGSRFDGGKRPSRSLADAPAYGTDGTELRDSTVFDSVCSGLCDECLSGFLSHRAHTAGTSQSIERSVPLPSQTAHDNEPPDCVAASLAAWPLGVQVSTSFGSWRQHRGACSRCDLRAYALSEARSSSPDAQAFAGMTFADYTRRLKHKDMVPTPWLVAMALQAAGWYLRSDIIWANDADAIAEPLAESSWGRYQHVVDTNEQYVPSRHKHQDGIQSPMELLTRAAANVLAKGIRNKRTVWTIPTMPYAGAHFATMPEALVEPCILAGCPLGGLVLDPFLGSGTVGAVAERLSRQWVGLDLTYQHLSKHRTAQRGLNFAEPIAADVYTERSGLVRPGVK